MNYTFHWMPFIVFLLFVAAVLAISFYFGSKARSAKGYYAAHGQINWFVNGIAFAGDYLSAASFLGICGLIAFFGYDGFLYSIGYLAGWVVALFVIAEPLKKLGKFTFADALDKRFNSRGIKLTAAVSTLVVSMVYLIPQMVGAGVLIKPLLGLPEAAGVIIVGVIVVLIVVTAGMVSTTYVQFIKGSLLVTFCTILVAMILHRGLEVPTTPETKQVVSVITNHATGKTTKLVNGLPQGDGPGEGDLAPVGRLAELPNGQKTTGPLGPLEYLSTLQRSRVVLWKKAVTKATVGDITTETTTYSPTVVEGSKILVPGRYFTGVVGDKFVGKLDFISLMLALFGGTASLPHILIRYYTVKDAAAARKSTIVGIATIGFFYILTLFLGLGAMTSGTMDVTNNNMAAPLLAKSFSALMFSIISAIAFTTVLGTVSGLIIAASGAVAHDLMTNFLKMDLSDHAKVNAGKVAAVVVGVIAMALGILFQKFNVSYLVGWAFNVAASANLPALVMLLFWKRTTKQGITAGIAVGLVTSVVWLLLTKEAYEGLYGFAKEAAAAHAIAPFSQPAIITIPLGFAVLVLMSLLTARKDAPRAGGMPMTASAAG